MHSENIIEVTSEGIRYLDENREEQFIDFAECYQRYLDGLNDPEHIKGFKEANPTRSDEELEANLNYCRSLKKVADRDFTVPYIEFYTQPRIRFNFPNRDEYDEVIWGIRKAGWRTYDMA